MLVRSDRRHRFPVGPDELWAAIGEVDDYRRWWPWLRRFEAAGLAAGDVWSCTVQPPLPWTLRFSIALDDVVEATSIHATVSGDIVGTARLELDEVEPGTTEVQLVSELSPGNPFLRRVAVFAQPLVRFGHDWVLDSGARQFRARAF